MLLGAPGEPLFTDGADKQVGGHAGHTAIATVLTGRLHSDLPHSPSPRLLAFAFVLFDKREQFFETQALVHAVKAPALAPCFR